MEGAAEHSEGGCVYVGESMADIAGVGIIIGFVGQALISLLLAVWVFFLSEHGDLDVHHKEGTIEREIEHKRLEFISEILMTGNDIQMMLGMSYMITVFASSDTIDLYHLRLVFDIVSFVGVSNAAALVCWTFIAARLPHKPTYKELHRPKRAPKNLPWFVGSFTDRHQTTYIFSIMFIALTAMLGIRLDQWAPDAKPGRCYHDNGTARPGSSHPTLDKVYIGVTATWMLLAMASAAFFGARRRRWVLVSAFLQFPVHLYMTLALRYANQGKLEGEEGGENGWDFGQTTATVLLGVAVADVIKNGTEYFWFERDIRKNGIRKLDSTVSGASENRELEELRTGDGRLPQTEYDNDDDDDEARLSENHRRSEHQSPP